VSASVREIFRRHTDLIEPLSLDEAYLDVTTNKTVFRRRRWWRRRFATDREELNLTASAGVAPNKFLAKIASDWRKPDGLFGHSAAGGFMAFGFAGGGRIPGWVRLRAAFEADRRGHGG